MFGLIPGLSAVMSQLFVPGGPLSLASMVTKRSPWFRSVRGLESTSLSSQLTEDAFHNDTSRVKSGSQPKHDTGGLRYRNGGGGGDQNKSDE